VTPSPSVAGEGLVRLQNLSNNFSNTSFVSCSTTEGISKISQSTKYSLPTPQSTCGTTGHNPDFFINISRDTYKGMLEDFIKHHGTSSDKCKELILEEGDIADRIYNIHTITGNNFNPLLFNKLKKSFSQEFDISSITSVDQINDGAKLVQDLTSIFN